MKKILIVEKEESIGSCIRDTLSDLGIFSVVHVDNFDKALSLLVHESFDLIIFEPFVSSRKIGDRTGGVSNGIRVLKEMTRRFKEVPVIVFSAHYFRSLKKLGLNRHKNVHLLTKSGNLSELLLKISDVLHVESALVVKTVLLVMPGENLGELYKEELEDFLHPFSIRVIYRKDYDDALILLSHEKVTLIVIDVDYFDEEANPQKGINTFDKIRREHGQIPVIVTSLLPGSRTEYTEFLKLVGTNFVLKSADLTRLKLKVCDFLGIDKQGIVKELIGNESNSLRNKVRIFICYAKEDFAKADLIYARLKEEKYSPWMDKRNIVGGQDWEIEITRAIDECEFFVACLSKHSVSKEGYIQKELKKGLEIYDRHPEGSIFLIPVRFDECKVPERFKKIQWIDLFEPNGMEDLLKAIETGCKQRGILS